MHVLKLLGWPSSDNLSLMSGFFIIMPGLQEVEHCFFTPLVFSTSGGMGVHATVMDKRLAYILSHQGREILYYRTTMDTMLSLLLSPTICNCVPKKSCKADYLL